MAQFEEWELHDAPYVDIDGDVEIIAHTWQSYGVRGAYAFIDELKGCLEKIDPKHRMSSELEFRTWSDREGYPEGSVSLSYHRPATEKEILMDKAKRQKSVTDDCSWLEKRIGSLIQEAQQAGLSAEEIGIAVSDGAYTISRKEVADQE